MKSMTGFAVASRKVGVERVDLTIRSLNSRNLDVRVSLPVALAPVEPIIRQQIEKVISRGRVDVHIKWEHPHLPERALDLNRILLLKKQMDKIFKVLGDNDGCPPHILFQFKDFILHDEISSPSPAVVETIVEKLLPVALRKLLRYRQQEGQRMQREVKVLLKDIEVAVTRMKKAAESHMRLARKRFAESVATLTGVNDEALRKKIEVEVATVLTKRDVNEELVRMRAHIKAFKSAMKRRGPVGRELDFIAQEIHREASTIAAKSFTAELTHLSVRVRTLTDQLREIIANVE